jgi:hypothetical protein
MITELRLSSVAPHDPTEALTSEQKEALQRVVAKVVALGAQVGVSADQMILLLQSGLTPENCWTTWPRAPEKLPRAKFQSFQVSSSRFQSSRFADAGWLETSKPGL